MGVATAPCLTLKKIHNKINSKKARVTFLLYNHNCFRNMQVVLIAGAKILYC
jgi:hypothetical protein